jgi:hypothetical protein
VIIFCLFFFFEGVILAHLFDISLEIEIQNVNARYEEEWIVYLSEEYSKQGRQNQRHHGRRHPSRHRRIIARNEISVTKGILCGAWNVCGRL